MSDRRKQIEDAAKISANSMAVKEDWSIGSISWMQHRVGFYQGAEWADANPVNIPDLKWAAMNQQLTQAQELLKKAKEMADKIGNPGIQSLFKCRCAARAWLREYQSTMKRKGGE